MVGDGVDVLESELVGVLVLEVVGVGVMVDVSDDEVVNYRDSV